MNRKTKWFLYSVFPILICGMMYYVFCPDVAFVMLIDKTVGGAHISIELDNIFIQMIRFYFFDFCWAFSLTSTVMFLFSDTVDEPVCFGTVLVFEIIIELLQLLPMAFGTFDIWDIVVEIIANVVALMAYRKGLS